MRKEIVRLGLLIVFVCLFINGFSQSNDRKKATVGATAEKTEITDNQDQSQQALRDLISLASEINQLEKQHNNPTLVSQKRKEYCLLFENSTENQENKELENFYKKCLAEEFPEKHTSLYPKPLKKE